MVRKSKAPTAWDYDFVIPKIRCLGCGGHAVTYDGNYFCTECDWALPDFWDWTGTPEELHRLTMWFRLAYLHLQHARGVEPVHLSAEEVEELQDYLAKGGDDFR